MKVFLARTEESVKTVTTPTLVVVLQDTTEQTVRLVGIVNTPKFKRHTFNNVNIVITVKLPY